MDDQVEPDVRGKVVRGALEQCVVVFMVDPKRRHSFSGP